VRHAADLHAARGWVVVLKAPASIARYLDGVGEHTELPPYKVGHKRASAQEMAIWEGMERRRREEEEAERQKRELEQERE
jgi:hypothetical protein